MTRLEVAKALNKIMIDNHFSILDRDNCYDKFSDKINSMQEIFHLRSSSDFTYFFAISHLLSDNENAVNEYLLKENKSSSFIKDLRQPNRDDYLLVATAFEDNPEFFSMAWNWVVIIKNRIALKIANKPDSYIIVLFPSKADLLHNQCVESDMFISVNAASESGFNNITRIPIDLLGELEIQGNRETKRIFFTIFLNPENENLKFELEIEFEVDGVLYKTSLRKDYDDPDREISGKPIHVDFTKGFVLKKFTWKRI